MTADYKVHGDVAVITMNNPPVNGLSHATRVGINFGAIGGMHRGRSGGRAELTAGSSHQLRVRAALPREGRSA